MPRIRSIKPEFWTDGSNLELSDSCSLFFIGLWNFCDDEGKHRLDLKQLVAELGGRWHAGKVKLFVSCLIKSGQLRINSDSTWIQVTGWSHQKIDKPKQPEVKSADLQWLSHEESAKALEQSRPFDARIGSDRKDRIGSDRLPRAPKVAKPVQPSVNLNAEIWNAYSEAYQARYLVEPARNAKVNSIVSQLAKRLGTDAIDVVRFYLTHNKAFYLGKLHDIGLCLSDAEALRTQWARGKAITEKDVKAFTDVANVVQLAADAKAGGF